MNSLKNLINYIESDEELEYAIRMSHDWNEESFIKMVQLLENVKNDYTNSDCLPKTYVMYCVSTIPRILGMLHHFKNSTDEKRNLFIEEKAERLRQISQDFIGVGYEHEKF